MQETATNEFKVNFKIIDWMRGLAALYVVFNHSRGFLFTKVATTGGWRWWEWLDIMALQQTNLSVEFVTLFFLLSGFSIAHSLSGEHKVSAFYSRRLVRLYPPYLLGIAWAFVVFLTIKALATDVFAKSIEGHLPLDIAFHKFESLKVVLSNLFYMPVGNYLTPQYWSLPYEVIFYLSIPWAIRRFGAYAVFTVVIFLLGCFFFGPWVLDTDDALTVRLFNHDIVTFYLPQYFIDFNLFFIIGFMFYKYKDKIIAKFRLNKWLCFAILLVLFECMVWIKAYKMGNRPNKVTDLIMVVFTFILIFSALRYNVRIKWLEKIGAFSYTLYVTHVASIFLVKLALHKLGFHFYDINNLYSWWFGIVTAVFVAYLLYFVAEYPAVKYLKKLRAKSKQDADTYPIVTAPVVSEVHKMGLQKIEDPLNG